MCAGLLDMPLVDVEISINNTVLPDDILAFLHEADSRVSRFVDSRPICSTGFVPSDFVTVYRALRTIIESDLAPGNSLCEWGSGFGVVASLASMLGFRVCGIELEERLVDASRNLADDFGLSVEFAHGSFVPPGAESYAEEAYLDNNSKYLWLTTDADDAYDKLGLDPRDFDVFFAYPWPGEEYLFISLFGKYAADESLLLMYDQLDSVRLLRKVAIGSVGV